MVHFENLACLNNITETPLHNAAISLRTADVFPVVASLPPKNNVCEPERQNDFCDVKPFVSMLANQIKG